MKYAPQKVFILEGNDYIELTYPEYCSRCEKDASYLKKRFLPLYGMLMEVSEKDYGSTAQLLRQALSNHPSGRKP